MEILRLSIHLLAVTIWVGGQLTLLALLPVLRQTTDTTLPSKAAHAYNRIAWPAFAVLIATGIWNIAAEDDLDQGLLGLKLALVAVSGLATVGHIKAATPKMTGIFGALGLFSALAAVVVGVALAG